MPLRLAVWSLLVLASTLPAQAPRTPAPEDVIGFKPGTDGMLADYGKILEYFRKLSDASDRVDLRVVGKTTEGRDMALAVISAPENLRTVERIREDNLRLADPRRISEGEAEAITARGKVIVLVNESIHSNEVGPAQAGMTTAHFLAATSDPAWMKVLTDAVLLLNPCHNPDGYDTVVQWWNRFKDDPNTRGAPLPVLYHKYVGHDNNRDWFMFTQQETRVTVQEMHLKWRPQIVVDQHQMGAGGPRMFIPPYQEPWEPNVHPLLRKQLEALGRSVIKALTNQGLKGVCCNRTFDAWSPSRAYMHYHGGVRVLTEVASCAIADPVERSGGGGGGRRRAAGGGGEAGRGSEGGQGDRGRGGEGGDRSGGELRERSPSTDAASEDYPAPWTGGRWTLGDIVTYSREAVLQALKHASDHRAAWIKNFYSIHKDACLARTGPRGYLVPMDQPRRAALARLMDILSLGAVEMGITAEPFKISGRSAPAGSLFIPSAQPCFSFARALFEPSPYPEIRTTPGGPIRRPYDVTAHCLPLLMNLEVIDVPSGPLPKVTGQRAEPTQVLVSTQVIGDVLLDPRDEGAAVDALRLLSQGVRIERVLEPVDEFPPGAFIVRSKDGSARLRHARSHPVPKGLSGQPLRAPRIGVFWSWMASMDEGWTRFFFDSFGLPFLPLRPADLRAGNIQEKVDVIVFANISRSAIVEGQSSPKLPEDYRGGIGKEGEVALKSFVEGGGTLLTLNDSSTLPIRLFDLPLVSVPAGGRALFSREGEGGEPPAPAPEAGDSTPKETGRFDIPGAILVAEVDSHHPLGFGCVPRTPVFCLNDRGFALAKEARTQAELVFPVRYAKQNLVACGFTEGAQALAGQGAVAVARLGQGQAVLFSFSPQFRCQTWATFPLFLNALLLAASTPPGG